MFGLAYADAHLVGGLAVDHQRHINLATARERAWQSYIDLVEAGEARHGARIEHFTTHAADSAAYG